MQSGLACVARKVESICRAKASEITVGLQQPYGDTREVANWEGMGFKDVSDMA